MRHCRFLLAGILSILLASGHAMIGCGDDEGEFVTVELGQLCAQSLRDMNSQGCMDSAYANVDDLKDCFVACGPADEECLDICFDAPGSGFSTCSGDVDLLFTGQCGPCYTDCWFDFVGDESELGCLFNPGPEGTECLDALYDCVNSC